MNRSEQRKPTFDFSPNHSRACQGGLRAIQKWGAISLSCAGWDGRSLESGLARQAGLLGLSLPAQALTLLVSLFQRGVGGRWVQEG